MSDPPCSVEGCRRKWSVLTDGRRLCDPHYHDVVVARHREALREIESIRADVTNVGVYAARLEVFLDEERQHADRLATALEDALAYCDGHFVKKWELVQVLHDHSRRRTGENGRCKTSPGGV